MSKEFPKQTSSEKFSKLEIPDEILAKERLIGEKIIKGSLEDDTYNAEKHRNWSTNVDTVDRWIDYLNDGLVSKQLFIQEMIPIIGVEKDENNNLILYHATPFLNLLSILDKSSIDPVIKHGREAYGLHKYSAEQKDIEENQFKKVYLSSRKQALYVSSSIVVASGSPIYVLEVAASPDLLRIDEDCCHDSRENAWAYSLSLGGTCSHLGSIRSFKIAGKLSQEPSLPQDKEKLIRFLREKNTDGIMKMNVEIKERLQLAKENEKEQLSLRGISFDDIRVFKDRKETI